MEIGFAAWPLDRDQVAAAVIVEGHVQRLMNIANPMPEAFEKPRVWARYWQRASA
jgi:hypothetical protein